MVQELESENERVFRESIHKQTVRETEATKIGAAALAPGYLIATEFRTEGGRVYTRKPRGGTKVLFAHKPDDKRLDKLAEKTINRANTLVNMFCTPLFAALHYCTPENLPRLHAALDESRESALACNMFARDVKSDRETRIRIYTSYLNVHDPEMSMRYAEITRLRLSQWRERFKDSPSSYRNAWVMVRFAWHAVVGRQRDILKHAIEATEKQREDGLMIYHAGGRRGTKDLRRAYPDVKKIPDIDYGPIDAAIKMYAKAENWSITTK